MWQRIKGVGENLCWNMHTPDFLKVNLLAHQSNAYAYVHKLLWITTKCRAMFVLCGENNSKWWDHLNITKQRLNGRWHEQYVIRPPHLLYPRRVLHLEEWWHLMYTLCMLPWEWKSMQTVKDEWAHLVSYIYCRFLIIWQASISTDILRCMWVVCTYWFCTTRPQLNQRKWHFASCHGLDWNISYILPYCRCMSVSETTFTLVGVCFLSACAVTIC